MGQGWVVAGGYGSSDRVDGDYLYRHTPPFSFRIGFWLMIRSMLASSKETSTLL
jgi:hypothetical protein